MKSEVLIIETVDTLYAAAAASDEDSEEQPYKSHGERLKNEAKSLRHTTVHDRKNPHSEACERGRILRRHTHGTRPIDEDEPVATAYAWRPDRSRSPVSFRKISGLLGEKAALVIRDRHGISVPQP